jgi:hypothetical protein
VHPVPPCAEQHPPPSRPIIASPTTPCFRIHMDVILHILEIPPHVRRCFKSV